MFWHRISDKVLSNVHDLKCSDSGTVADKWNFLLFGRFCQVFPNLILLYLYNHRLIGERMEQRMCIAKRKLTLRTKPNGKQWWSTWFLSYSLKTFTFILKTLQWGQEADLAKYPITDSRWCSAFFVLFFVWFTGTWKGTLLDSLTGNLLEIRYVLNKNKKEAMSVVEQV